MLHAGDSAKNAVDAILTEYRQTKVPWIIGYSGGKDSSVVVKLVFRALAKTRRHHQPVNIVYCDTGVEIPIVHDYVLATLRRLAREARQQNLPIRIETAVPELHERFFVKVIGWGYVPPTSIFRWCTRRLRTAPVRAVMERIADGERMLLLGLRNGESSTRDRTLKRYSTKNRQKFHHAGDSRTILFCPIIDFSVEDVWETLVEDKFPYSIDGAKIAKLYREASGECPVIREVGGSPCGKGRFGCWTCTVVSQDKASINLVSQGYESLGPLLHFRNWLQLVRDDPSHRTRRRRNGARGMGPFLLSFRKEILRRLMKAELRSGHSLISREEIKLIRRIWQLDPISS